MLNMKRKGDFLSMGWFAATLAIYVILFCLVWLCFKGWVNYDAGLQWAQVQTGHYDNWHPFVHTVVFMKLPSLIWNDYRVVILAQIIFFSFSIGYVARTLEIYGANKILCNVIMLCVILHPLTMFFVQTMPKDTVFAIFTLLSMAAVLRIIKSEGNDLGVWPTSIVLAVCISFACLVRHNGIFFAMPLIMALVIRYIRKSYIDIVRIGIFISIMLVLFKMIIPQFFDVKPASQHMKQYLFIESSGVPLTMMGAIYAKCPERVSEKAVVVLDSIRPREIWRERYKLGSFNEVKHAGVAKLPEETIGGIVFPGWLEFAKIFYDTVKIDPKLAFSAWVALTEQVWNPFALDDKNLTCPLVKTGCWKYRAVIIPIVRFLSIPIFGIIPLSVLLVFVLSIRAVFLHRYDALMVAVPLLCYDLGTMMLLSGFNMQRLFFCNILLGLLVIWSMINHER